MTNLPCACGGSDADWHGDTARVYVCAQCWRSMVMSEVHAAFAKVAEATSNAERVSQLCDALDDETAKGARG